MTSYSNRCAALAAAEGCSLMNVAFIRSNRICRSSKTREPNVRFGAGEPSFLEHFRKRHQISSDRCNCVRSYHAVNRPGYSDSTCKTKSKTLSNFFCSKLRSRRTYEYRKEISYVTINDFCNSKFQVFLCVRTSTTLSLTASIGVTDRCFNS